MDRCNNRELIAQAQQDEMPVPPAQEFFVPFDEDMIDVLEEDRSISVERT